ncbi:MAG: DUF5819 family protein [Acidobacteriota bacterium]
MAESETGSPAGRIRLKTIGYRALQIGSILALTIHFAMTVLWVGPFNPIKVHLNGLLEKTTGRYFSQSWRIFAPLPVTTDDAVLLRCLTPREAAAPRLPDEGWYDISTPLWIRFQHDRFSAWSRLSRPQTYAVRTYLTAGPDAVLWFNACQGGSQPACSVYQSMIESARQSSGEILTRIGSAACNDLGRSQSTARVALRLRRTWPISWSQRSSATQRLSEDLPVGVYEYRKEIGTPGIFRDGARE